MKPIGPLMQEHRLIERMIALLSREMMLISVKKATNVEFLTAAVDFIRTYADATHHGKEEGILFRDLAKKPLTDEHARIMKELIEEHVYARTVTAALADAADKYSKGSQDSLNDISSRLYELISFYPKHIEKEDKHFFYPAQEYFSKQEQDEMLKEFWEFDRKIIHDKYRKSVEKLEQQEL